MNQDLLNRTARELRQPTPEAAQEFETLRDALAEELNCRMSARPDLEKLIGPGNLAMMRDNSRNFCRFMGGQFHGYEPTVLVETAPWVFRAYRAHGFQTTYWPANLDTFIEIARARLSPATFDQVQSFFQWLIVNVPIFVKLSQQAPGPSPVHQHPITKPA